MSYSNTDFDQLYALLERTSQTVKTSVWLCNVIVQGVLQVTTNQRETSVDAKWVKIWGKSGPYLRSPYRD